MRLSALCVFAAAAILMGGCSKNASQQSATATEAPQAAATTMAKPAAGGGTATMTNLPEYPGATKMASGASGMAAGGSAAGTVLSTSDPFAKVYKWYQDKMPAGSEKAHQTTAMGETAVFTVGEMGKDQQSVTLTATAGKTMITLAHVKR
jgi:hypothetical protein